MPAPAVVVLVVLGAWLGVGLVVELLAWRGWRLGRRAAPPVFRAPPREARSGEARLVFLGDLQRGVADVARPLAKVLRGEAPDLLVSSGDLIAHGEAPYYGVVFDAFEAAGLDVPARVVPGNHDLEPRGVRDGAAGRLLFREAFGGTTFHVDVGPVLVVGLDDALGPVPEADLEALDRALEERPGRPWILVCHRPLRRLARDGMPAEPDLLPLVTRVEARPPLLVVMGHDHESIEREVSGVLYVVNAHGGDVHGLGLDRGPFELLHVTVRADGTWEKHVTRHARKPWPRVYANQLAVRAWWARRRGLGRLLAAPAGWILRLLRARAPL